jgi:hypothetical protein
VVKQRGIAPHIPAFDKSDRTDGIFSRPDFVFDAQQDHYTCPGDKHLVQFHRTHLANFHSPCMLRAITTF